MDERRPGFWSTLPGILTGTAALIGAITTAYLAFNRGPTASSQTPVGPSPAVATAAPAPAATSNAEVRATIVDPDGWTNLRAEPGPNAKILVRINENEIFWTTPQDDAWWPARTAGGVEGYVHKSRVRLNP